MFEHSWSKVLPLDKLKEARDLLASLKNSD
jgi:hypothetical protein